MQNPKQYLISYEKFSYFLNKAISTVFFYNLYNETSFHIFIMNLTIPNTNGWN